MKAGWRVAVVIVVLVAAVLFGDYYFRCHSKPLSRDEAFQRATRKLHSLSQKFVVGDPPPAFVHEQYDLERKEWMFRFQNSTCTVDIVADRCQGTEVAGVNEGCKVR